MADFYGSLIDYILYQHNTDIFTFPLCSCSLFAFTAVAVKKICQGLVAGSQQI